MAGEVDLITELICLPTGEASDIIPPEIITDTNLVAQYGLRRGWVNIDLSPCAKDWDCDLGIWFPDVCRDEFRKRSTGTLLIEQSEYICTGSPAPVIWPGQGVQIGANVIWAPRVRIDESGVRLDVRAAAPIRSAMNVYHGVSTAVVSAKVAVVDTIQASEGDNADVSYPLDVYLYLPAGYTPVSMTVLFSTEPFRTYLPQLDQNAGVYPFKQLTIRDSSPHYTDLDWTLVATYNIPSYWTGPDIYGRVLVIVDSGGPNYFIDIYHVDSSTGTETLIASKKVGDGSNPGTKVVEFVTTPKDGSVTQLDFRGNQLKLVLRHDGASITQLWMRADVIMPVDIRPVPEMGVHEPADYVPATVNTIDVDFWSGTAPDFSTIPAYSAAANPGASRGVQTFSFSGVTLQTPGWFRVRLTPSGPTYIKASASITSIAVPS